MIATQLLAAYGELGRINFGEFVMLADFLLISHFFYENHAN